MKKLFSLLAVVVLAVGSVAARDRVTTDVKVLPPAAKEFLQKYYPKTRVNHIKVDSKVVGASSYDVILSNGVEIDFDSKGSLDEIDCGYMAVPSGIILKPIRDYVAKNFKGQKIVSFDVNRNNYEVELGNGVELKFDRAGNFKRMDD